MWAIERIVNFSRDKRFTGDLEEEGLPFLGLHGREGVRFALGPERDRIICVDPHTGSPLWTAGPRTEKTDSAHITADLKRPSWVEDFGDGTYLVCSAGRGRLWRISPKEETAAVYVDLKPHGVHSPANCVLDAKMNIWVNDPTLKRLWVFDPSGKLLRSLGETDAVAAMTPEGTASRAARGPAGIKSPLEDMDLAEVYDIRVGADGLVYILEGGRLRLRAIDFERNLAKVVAGTGVWGYTGDGGDPRKATFGRRHVHAFDGPWAFCMDRRNAIYIADTQNGVVRMIDRERRSIVTIAGNGNPRGGERNSPEETNPLKLNLPSVLWMDWGGGRLFISDEIGDLIVLSQGG